MKFNAHPSFSQLAPCLLYKCQLRNLSSGTASFRLELYKRLIPPPLSRPRQRQPSVRDKFVGLFFCRHVGAAERFRAVAHQHKGFGSDIGYLVVVFGAEKDDLVFLDDTLFTF